jgi:acyl-CoA-binding protein
MAAIAQSAAFKDAVRRADGLRGSGKTLTDAQLLQLYGAYKQGTEGDAPTACRCGMLDFKGKAKHEAWARNRGVPPAAAQAAYVGLVTQMLGPR